MPAKPSGEVRTRFIRSTQPNGDIYILERKTKYDPELKWNHVLGTKLLEKIPKGTETPVPTRPKMPQGNGGKSPSAITAEREHIGMMEIIGHIGAVSGIDDGIYNNTDLGTAQKIISVARYLLATNGQSLPGILTWQFNHPLPYKEGLSEYIYHDLFATVGRDESLRQNFFASRCEGIKQRATLAYDSSTVSTYSKRRIEARYGFNKAEDGLETIKVLTLYSIDTKQPVAYTKQPGNLPDVITIENALAQLSALGMGNAEIVTDNGYYSEHNLTELFLAHFDFITLAKASIKWIKAEIDRNQGAFGSVSSACPFDTQTHGITITLMHEFAKTRKYANSKTGAQKGDEEKFRRRVYLHVYFNPKRKADDDADFDNDLIGLRRAIEEGAALSELSDSAQSMSEKYLSIRDHGTSARVAFNEAACDEAKKYHGYFALVSNCEKEAFECLQKYRKRELIESFFESMKQHADGARVRVWDTDTLMGRLFVQFVSLCYYEYLSEEIRKLKESLAKPNGNPKHDSKENLELEKKLNAWLGNTPIYLILQWFDTVESFKVSSSLHSMRWNTEVTARDRMLLEKLGITSLL